MHRQGSRVHIFITSQVMQYIACYFIHYSAPSIQWGDTELLSTSIDESSNKSLSIININSSVWTYSQIHILSKLDFVL